MCIQFVKERLRQMKAAAQYGLFEREADEFTPLMAHMLALLKTQGDSIHSEEDIVAECMAHL